MSVKVKPESTGLDETIGRGKLYINDTYIGDTSEFSYAIKPYAIAFRFGTTNVSFDNHKLWAMGVELTGVMLI
jgi:hypothetical protein